MMNPAKLLKIKGAWDKFSYNHPKFEPFVKAVQKNAIEEGTIIEINFKTAEGQSINTNLKLTKDDLELFRDLSDLMSK